MDVVEDAFVKLTFVLHIHTNGTNVTEREVKILLTRVGLILTTDNTRFAELLGRYEMRPEQNIVRFVDPNTETEISTTNFANRLCNNERVFIVGTIELAENQISALIEGICCNLPEHIVSWSFRPENGSLYATPRPPTNMQLDVVSFRFGNIINGNCFAYHLNDFETKEGERFGLMSNMEMKISHSKKQLTLRFKMTYCVGTNLNLKNVHCKLVFDFCSFKEIITSVDYISEYYLRYDYPPRFLVKDGNNWNRWTDCDLISREIIGKSKVLRIKVDQDEPEDEDDIPDTLIPELYSIFGPRNEDVICVQMRDYCIDFTYNVSDRALPFEVKYILQCLDSVSFAFADDLIINNRRLNFNNLLDSLVANGRCALVIEALTRIFNSYFYNQQDIFDAYENFTHLLTIVGDRIGEDLAIIGDKRDCLKRIVLTPMRTLFLPPSSTETRFLSGNIDMNRLIKVHLRDDDHSRAFASPYPYLSEDFGETDFYYQLRESKCRNYFLKNVIIGRLLGENGILRKYSYKYHGTSLSELFTDGIVLEAESTT